MSLPLPLLLGCGPVTPGITAAGTSTTSETGDPPTTAGDEDAPEFAPACKDGCTCGPDGDGDGHPDDCDSCPELANPVQNGLGCMEDDRDRDGIGAACDPCPLSKGVGPGGRCCHPLHLGCVTTCPLSVGLPICVPGVDGLTFECDMKYILDGGTSCIPAGAVPAGGGPPVTAVPGVGVQGVLVRHRRAEHLRDRAVVHPLVQARRRAAGRGRPRNLRPRRRGPVRRQGRA